MEKNQCKNCPFKNDYFNMLKQGDAIVIGKEIKEYCYMFDKGIPKEILDDKKECTYKKIDKDNDSNRNIIK